MQLFTPDATWKKAAEHTRVFKLYGSFVNPARQGQIDTIVADLKRRGIAIGLETGTIDVNFKNPVPPCGGLGLVEGYGTPAQAANICAKIKKAGGRIDFLCMDEPLYYGHYFTKRAGKSQPGCQSPVDTILRLMIPTLNVYRQAFPDIVVGEVEPTEIAAFPGWQQVLSDWTAGFRALNGRPLAFMQLDIPWANRAPSVEPADAVAYFHFCETLRERHLLDKIGIIYDGTPLDTTDAAWMQDARNHLVELSDRYQLHPDMAIFQSWMPHPTHAMPDSDPNTLSSIVEFYVQRANRR
ncbi:hypothetical protein [Dinghuibacter silviterrae]|nr:hypothetical protein [Dinghuibacter silviterrae]